MNKKSLKIGDTVILKSNNQEVIITGIEKKCCGNKNPKRLSVVEYPTGGFMDRKVTFMLKDHPWVYGYEIKLKE